MRHREEKPTVWAYTSTRVEEPGFENADFQYPAYASDPRRATGCYCACEDPQPAPAGGPGWVGAGPGRDLAVVTRRLTHSGLPPGPRPFGHL